MRVLKRRGELADAGRLTYHGSAPLRDRIKHLRRADRWWLHVRAYGLQRSDRAYYERGPQATRPGASR